MKRIALACFVLVLLSCHQSPQKTNANITPLFQFGADCKICDSCKTVIRVKHTESTDSGDIEVDSGVVYLPQKIVRRLNAKFDSLRKNFKPSLFKPTMAIYDRLNYHDIDLANKSNLVWENHFGSEQPRKAYKLSGKIVNCKLNDDDFPRLLFHVDKIVPVEK